MVGAAFAAVPLYRAFCEATGFGGTTQVARVAPAARGARTLTVRFDANVAPRPDWSFEPETPTVTLRTGATATVFFRVHNRERARNRGGRGLQRDAGRPPAPGSTRCRASASPSSTSARNETAELPVVFFLDPRLEQDHTMDASTAITLSYTFFARERRRQAGGAGAAGGRRGAAIVRNMRP